MWLHYKILVALERCFSSKVHFPWSMSLGDFFAGRERLPLCAYGGYTVYRTTLPNLDMSATICFCLLDYFFFFRNRMKTIIFFVMINSFLPYVSLSGYPNNNNKYLLSQPTTGYTPSYLRDFMLIHLYSYII